MSLVLLSSLLLVACSNDKDISQDVVEQLNTKYDTTFQVTREYKPKEIAEGVKVQEGTVKSSEGYYVDYTYNLETKSLEDNYDTAIFNRDTSNAIGKYLSLAEEDYVLYSYLNSNNILEVVLALDEGVTYSKDTLQEVANSYLSPVAEISVYDVSSASFKSLKNDFEESGTLTNKTIKGYLFTDKKVYSTPFDINNCFEDKALSTTDRCMDYRETVSNEVVTTQTPKDTEASLN